MAQRPASSDVARALEAPPRGVYVLTAAFEDRRGGQVVHWVQPCSHEPALICVAARTGHKVEPLIRDSRCFAICRLDPDDRLLARVFADEHAPDDGEADAFDSLEFDRLVTGAPILKRSACALDCEVVRHFDLEADHEIYIGLVRAVRGGRG